MRQVKSHTHTQLTDILTQGDNVLKYLAVLECLIFLQLLINLCLCFHRYIVQHVLQVDECSALFQPNSLQQLHDSRLLASN